MSVHVFSVPDMMCSHCKMRVSKALEGKVASFSVDLAKHEVTVDTGDVAAVCALLDEAGYPAAEKK